MPKKETAHPHARLDEDIDIVEGSPHKNTQTMQRIVLWSIEQSKKINKAASQHFRLICIVEMHSRKLRHDDTSAKNVTQYVGYALASQQQLK